MRWCDIVSGILLILSIIDFALAAPISVQVQEKRQACVNVVHIPNDLMTVLGKRGNEELEKLLEEYFNAMGKQVESSDAHASSGSASSGSASSGTAPSELDHGSTNVVQAPASTPYPSEQYFKTWKPPNLDSSDVHASSSPTLPGTDHGSTNVVQAPASNSAPSITNPDPLIESSGPSLTAPMQGS
jgi:hypothetical protein